MRLWSELHSPLIGMEKVTISFCLTTTGVCVDFKNSGGDVQKCVNSTGYVKFTQK